MSHAANLRSSQRAAQASPSKKRKLSEGSTRPTVNGINGIHLSDAPTQLSAVPVTDVKALKEKQLKNTATTIGHVDEDTAQQSADIVEISSANSSDDEDEEGEGEHDRREDSPEDHNQKLNGNTAAAPGKSVSTDNDVSNPDSPHDGESRAQHAQDKPEETVSDEGPSFGDMLRIRDPMTVDLTVQDDDGIVDGASNRPEARAGQRSAMAIPSASSLGTVLTQALRTNDVSLLESCLRTTNLQSIRATIERLPSPQAGILLRKLAERMYKRPGRAGSLMVWVQWTIVAHGGYLATQPAVMVEVRELYRVVKMRAQALPHLLSLKGKLDMLEAQQQLRRNRFEQAPRSSTAHQGRNEGIIYIEGESEDEGHAKGQKNLTPRSAAKTQNLAKAKLHREVASESEDDDVPMANGVTSAQRDAVMNDDSEGLSSDDEDEDLIDDEAESTDDEEGEGISDEEIDFDDVDELDGEDDESEPSDSEDEPAPKRKKQLRT